MEPSLSEPPVAPVEPGPEVVTYELVEEASKQRRTKLIDSRGYSYNVKRRTKSATIWQCSVRTKSSYCKATVKEIHGQFTETQSHNHQPAVGAVTAAKVVTAVKRKALEDVFKPAPAIVHEVKRHCIFHYINIAITNMVSYFLQVLLEEMSTAPCPAISTSCKYYSNRSYLYITSAKREILYVHLSITLSEQYLYVNIRDHLLLNRN